MCPKCHGFKLYPDWEEPQNEKCCICGYYRCGSLTVAMPDFRFEKNETLQEYGRMRKGGWRKAMLKQIARLEAKNIAAGR